MRIPGFSKTLEVPSSESSTLTWFGMRRLELAAKLRLLADDVERGEPPTADTVGAAVDQWALARRSVPCLIGIPSGHPTVEDGAPFFSSELFFMDIEQGFARSFSRWYQLHNRVEPDFWNSKYEVR